MIKIHNIPTWKLKEILEHPYCQGVDGKDYEPLKEEMQAELWKRQDKENEKYSKQLENDKFFDHQLSK